MGESRSKARNEADVLLLPPSSLLPIADSILVFFTSFLLLSIYYYLPTHVSFLRRRTAYYITGDESSSLLGEAGVRLLLDLFSGSKEVSTKSEL